MSALERENWWKEQLYNRLMDKTPGETEELRLAWLCDHVLEWMNHDADVRVLRARVDELAAQLEAVQPTKEPKQRAAPRRRSDLPTRENEISRLPVVLRYDDDT